MDRKVGIIFRAYLSLSDAQKSELIQTMNDYNGGTIEKKIALSHSAMRVDLGPVSGGGCPLCGK